MANKAASVYRKGDFSAGLVAEAASELREKMGVAASVAFGFVTPGYVPYLEEFSEIVRVDGHVSELVGCTGLGMIAGATEEEEEAGFSLVALEGKDTTVSVTRLSQADLETAGGKPEVMHGSWIALANPFVFDVESWIGEWNETYPGVPCIGGLASGDANGEVTAVFHNGKIVDGIAVGFSGRLRPFPVVSQGCRPIGEPLTVTRAEKNVVYLLGSRPAYEALESAYEALSDGEKAGAKGNLLAGLAGTEYVDDFKSGDFLVRNIIGADPDSGAVVIGGIPRVGQTLQYQLRDKKSAHRELEDALRGAAHEFGRPVASLLFSCAGRGSQFFGSKSHDAGLMETAFGQHPSAGFFCNGEIAPLGGKNYIHSYTVSCAVFVDSEEKL